MKIVTAFFLLLLPFLATAGESLIVPVIEVYDGDTVKTRLTLPNPLDKVSVRIYGIDSPEKPAKSYPTTGKLGRSKCVKEAKLSLEGTEYLETLIKEHGGMLKLKAYSWDKYGGRINADVYVIDLKTGTELNVADRMIEKGYAVEYFGGTKTKDWCN